MRAAESRTIDVHMSPLPIAVPPGVRVSDALARMDRLAVGHLVVEGAGVRAVLSQAEALVALRLGRDVPVIDVVDPKPVVVHRGASQRAVLSTMRERRASAALVLDGDRVVGIVTQSDVLIWLEVALGTEATISPAAVRARILGEHARIRAELADIEELALTVVRGGISAESLRERVRVLEAVLRGHLELEEALVLPWLRSAPGFGAESAQRVDEAHAEQRATLDGIIDGLYATRSPAELAVRTLELCTALRDDIRTEEETFLGDDGPLAQDVSVGFGG